MMKNRLRGPDATSQTRVVTFLVWSFSCVFFMSGCLQTRAAMKEQEEKQVLQKTVKNLQQSTADVNTRFQDIEEDLRKLNGRQEATDFRLTQLVQKNEKTDAAADGRNKEAADRLLAYQEAITKLDHQVTELTQTVGQLQEEVRRLQAAPVTSAGGSGGGSKGPLAVAEEHFKKQEWKEAILEYEKYRKSSPKGKQFADATYKIGVCFQEMGLVDEGKAFYEEVVAKFPKSKEAEKAVYRLKSLKKK